MKTLLCMSRFNHVPSGDTLRQDAIISSLRAISIHAASGIRHPDTASGSGIRHPVGVFPYVLTKIATQLNI